MGGILVGKGQGGAQRRRRWQSLLRGPPGKCLHSISAAVWEMVWNRMQPSVWEGASCKSGAWGLLQLQEHV